MNTNQSKRKAEFKKVSHYPLMQMLGRAIRKGSGNGFESRCVVINHSTDSTHYTENTIHFGEDYPAEKQL